MKEETGYEFGWSIGGARVFVGAGGRGGGYYLLAPVRGRVFRPFVGT